MTSITGSDAMGDARDEGHDKTFGLTRMIKLEVVVDSGEEAVVRDLLLGGGATGYTAVTGVSGFGHHGEHQGRLLYNDRATLSMVISVVPPERAQQLITGIRRLLDHRHGVLFVTETYVSRPDYFTA